MLPFGSSDRETVPDTLSWKWAIVLIVISYLFAAGTRYTWIYYAKSHDSFQWNGQPVTNNRDSFLFGSVLQKADQGLHQGNRMVPGLCDHGMITVLPYALLQVLPVSIDSLMVYVPIFTSAFICIPIVLIGRLYGSTVWGFFAALLGSVAVSYYNRTLAGYFDTDMYSVSFPMLALYFLLVAVRRESLTWVLLGSLALYVYPFFYYPGIPVGYALGFTFVVYQIAAFAACQIALRRTETFCCSAVILICLALALADFSRGTQLVDNPGRWALGWLVLLTAFFILKKNLIGSRALIALGLLALIGFILWAKPQQAILSRTTTLRTAQSPVSQAPSTVPEADPHREQTKRSLRFKNTLSTVRETKSIAFQQIAFRISGSELGALLALAGYLLLCVKHPQMLIALPLAGIGVFAYWGGLRFTIFAVPIAALGATYPFLFTGGTIGAVLGGVIGVLYGVVSGMVQGELATGLFHGLSLGGVSGVILGSGIQIFHQEKYFRQALDLLVGRTDRRHSRGDDRDGRSPKRGASRPRRKTPVPEVANHQSHPALAILTSILSRSTAKLVVAGIGTLLMLVPNFKHIYGYNIPVILENSAIAGLDKLRREYREEDYVITWWDYGSAVWYYSGCRTLNSPAWNSSPDNFLISKILATNSQRQAANLCREAIENFNAKKKYATAIQFILKDNSPHLKDPNQFLSATSLNNYVPSPKTREVFLFMPVEIALMFPAIQSFSNRDLLTGKTAEKPMYTIIRDYQKQDELVRLGKNILLDLESMKATFRGKKLPLKSFHTVEYNDAGKLQISSVSVNPDARYHIVYLRYAKLFLILDDQMFDSTFIQMFVFERFDPALFEPILLSPAGKIYRLKI